MLTDIERNLLILVVKEIYKNNKFTIENMKKRLSNELGLTFIRYENDSSQFANYNLDKFVFDKVVFDVVSSPYGDLEITLRDDT